MRWLVFAPVALLAVFSSGVQAQSNAGINTVYYSVTDIPPTKSDYAYQQCATEIENNINRSFDGESVDGCPDDMFMAHYTGFITLPQHNTIRFWVAADDGGTMKIGTDEWGDWTDKGCSALETEPLTLDAGVPLPLDAWFYENGGGTCFMLAWQIDNGDWEIVPDEAFTRRFELPTSTTSTTTSSTTTTEVPMPSTTTSVLPVKTTTTSLPVQTTVQASTSSQPSPVTTASTIAPTSTAQQTTSTISTFTTTSVSNNSTSTTTVDEVTTTTEKPRAVTTSNAPTTTAAIQTSTTTSVPVDALTEAIAPTASVEQVVKAVTAIIDQGISQEQATELATNPKVLASVDGEQAQKIFDAIDIDNISAEQAAQLVSAVQNAPKEVKEAFEAEVNVFAGAVDTYVPIGSNVPVSSRRVLIAVSAAMSVMPAPSRKVR
jgi:hypothetical protein